MSEKLRLPTCMGCDGHLFYSERYAKKQNGVLMKPGERYCVYGKRARRFAKSDPKNYPPSWCPKRKTPSEVRVYGFKSSCDWILHERLCSDLHKEILPEAHRYAVEYELSADLTPKQFWDAVQEEPLSSVLPVSVLTHWVIEIDDGLYPTFFYKTSKGFQIVGFFNAAVARRESMEAE